MGYLVRVRIRNPMIEALQEHLEILREAYVDALQEGKTTQAGNLLKSVHRNYEKLVDLISAARD